jgi:hypothetical protein
MCVLRCFYLIISASFQIGGILSNFFQSLKGFEVDFNRQYLKYFLRFGFGVSIPERVWGRF